MVVTKICDFCGLSKNGMWLRDGKEESYVCKECLDEYYENLDSCGEGIGDDDIYL